MSRKSNVVSLLVGFLSSTFAFLGIITCCGLPIVAGVLAWFGIGATQIKFFAEYHIWFIVIAIVALMFGFYQVYFKAKKNECCKTQKVNDCCSDYSEFKPKKQMQLFQKITLWSATLILVLMFVFDPSQNKLTRVSNQKNENQKNSVSTCCPQQVEKTSSCCKIE